MDEDVGGALAGPLDPATATGQWDDWLSRPGNRGALLQMGLQMMQPVGIGQTVGGHVAQSIGAGGEQVDRREAADMKDAIATSKMNTANERLQIAQQNADSNATRATAAASRATSRKVGGLTDLMRARFARDDNKMYEKRLDDDAKALEKQANDILADPNSPIVKQYKGKSKMDIREELRKTRSAPGASTTADGGDDEEADPVVDTPPVAGARKASDGNWYTPDPKNPTKYLKVTK